MNNDMQNYFEFLDNLRTSGVTNMYGAAPYIEVEFDVTRKEASSILKNWMETFTERHSK